MAKMSPEEEDAVQEELAALEREALVCPRLLRGDLQLTLLQPSIPSVPEEVPIHLPDAPETVPVDSTESVAAREPGACPTVALWYVANP